MRGAGSVAEAHSKSFVRSTLALVLVRHHSCVTGRVAGLQKATNTPASSRGRLQVLYTSRASREPSCATLSPGGLCFRYC